MLPYPVAFVSKAHRPADHRHRAGGSNSKERPQEAVDPVPIMTTSNVLAVMATPPTFGAGRSFSCRPYQWSQQR